MGWISSITRPLKSQHSDLKKRKKITLAFKTRLNKIENINLLEGSILLGQGNIVDDLTGLFLF